MFTALALAAALQCAPGTVEGAPDENGTTRCITDCPTWGPDGKCVTNEPTAAPDPNRAPVATPPVSVPPVRNDPPTQVEPSIPESVHHNDDGHSGSIPTPEIKVVPLSRYFLQYGF